MPADFNLCRQQGGRVRTIDVGNGKYLHVCYDKQGKSHKGEVKTKDKPTTRKGKK